jgi:CubicO group peptidase (beta-lactamase class C family)
MTWTEWTARALANAVRAADGLLVAAVAADENGYVVELSEGCPPDGLFEIGSVTKTMTGTLLASLVNDGLVGRNDEIGRWLDAGDNGDITLCQLATHTSGLPRLSPSHVLGAPNPYAFLTAEVAERELRSSPRRRGSTAHEYSNFGFQLLGLALERICSASFGELLTERVFLPLTMTRSGVGQAGRGTAIQGFKAGQPVTPWEHHLAGAGGVAASADDLAKYLHACLMPPAGPLGQAIRLAQQSHFQIDQLRAVGLGWALGPPGYLGYSGGTSGFRSMLGIKTADHRAAAIFVNDQDARGLAAATRNALDKEIPHNPGM